MTIPLSDQDWEAVVQSFRRLCMVKQLGNQEESELLLTKILPKHIASWSRTSNADPLAKKTQLNGMFKAEQQRVEDAILLHEVAAARWETQFLPQLCDQVSQEVRQAVSKQFAQYVFQEAEPLSIGKGRAQHFTPRITFDDVPGVIDLIIAQEQKQLRFEPAPGRPAQLAAQE